MALTISEKFRYTAGGRAFRVYEITHDGSTLTLTAGSMDLDYIEAIIAHNAKPSMQANTSVPLNLQKISIAANHKSVLWPESDANAVSQLTVQGW